MLLNMGNTLQFHNLIITINSLLNNKFVAFAIATFKKFTVANLVVLDWSLANNPDVSIDPGLPR